MRIIVERKWIALNSTDWCSINEMARWSQLRNFELIERWLFIGGLSIFLLWPGFFFVVGMTVVGTAGTPQGMDLVKSNGAHFVFNHR